MSLLRNSGIPFSSNVTTKLSKIGLFPNGSDDSLGLSIATFFIYLVIGFFIVFLSIGVCVLGHVVYMKYFKKPW
jgi:hypothetical protein